MWGLCNCGGLSKTLEDRTADRPGVKAADKGSSLQLRATTKTAQEAQERPLTTAGWTEGSSPDLPKSAFCSVEDEPEEPNEPKEQSKRTKSEKAGRASKERSKRTATLQELSSTYKRGVFDPSNPTGRLKTKRVHRNSGSTPSPKTPDQPLREATLANTGTASCETDSDTEENDGKNVNIFSTRSTLSAATSGRPQPIHEIQSLLGVTELGFQSQTDFERQSSKLASTENSGAGPPATMSRKSGVERSSLRSRTSQREESSISHDRLSSREDGTKGSRRGNPSVWEGLKRQQSFGNPVSPDRRTYEPHQHCNGISTGHPGSLDRHPYYKVLGNLTGGSNSNVLVCLDERSQETVAVKMLSRGVTNAKAAEREIVNLRLCAMHPYIIHLREVFLTSSHLALAMDYAKGGDLAAYIEMYQSSKTGKGISEERARLIFHQIVDAIEYCHKMGFANRDIKLENVLLVPNGEDKAAIPTVKLSDFGFSKDEYVDSVCKTACGTPECVAPEVLTGGLYEGKYSDIWSLGVLLYAMLTGNYPFSRPSDRQLGVNGSMKKLFGRIMTARFTMPQHISREAQDLLQQMLRLEPEDRIGITDVLQHPFFTANAKKNQRLESVNVSLLQVPDTMLTGFSRQTDEQIMQILKQASRTPTQPNGSNAHAATR